MKKIILSLLMFMTLAVSGCSCWDEKNTNKFVELKEKERIVVNGETLVNYLDEEVSNVYETIVTSRIHSLKRSSSTYYIGTNEYVNYGNYYYYWDTTNGTEDIKIGEKTTKIMVKYSYIEVEKNQKIMIKSTRTEEVSYSYKSEWISENPTDEYVLNGYFSSVAELQQACPELLGLVNEHEKFYTYVEANHKKNVTSNVEYLEKYYYFM